MNPDTILLEDILDAVLVEEPEPSFAALSRWCERYPEHREDLTEFFASWAVQAELPQDRAVDEERLANLSVSHALNILHERDAAAKRVPESSPRLIAAGRAAGMSEKELADRAGLNAIIIRKLDLRRLTGVPNACVERLAGALGVASAQMLTMISGPALVGAGTRYKATRKPVRSTEDFADAIRTSSLPEERKLFWLDVVATERRE